MVFIPDACLLTDAAGMILELNSAAAKLLNFPHPLLIGRSLIAFVTHETRQQFQIRLTHEDLATACCTTRVSITRLLAQFQQ